MRRFLLALICAGVPAIALAATLKPSTLVASPASYDGKTVTVEGTVSNFQTSSTLMGKVAGFQLCDSSCIVVVDKTAQTRSNGATVTVTGVFHTSFSGPKRTFKNAVVIGG